MKLKILAIKIESAATYSIDNNISEFSCFLDNNNFVKIYYNNNSKYQCNCADAKEKYTFVGIWKNNKFTICNGELKELKNFVNNIKIR